jgi:nitrogenase-stabilizing/protective protein
MDTLTQRLQALSSAEDFLRFFGVAHDEHVVRVNRLHILKRFHQYLNREALPAGDDVETFRRYRELLAKAYADFVVSTPAREKVFKVFHDAEGVSAVPVASLRQSLAERRGATA